jgi:tRNA G18 (ribose-2'-O)-methylase SpoU
LIVALEGVSNSENVGVVVRNCAAFGAGLLVIGETCASPYLRRAVRNSMGAIFQLPVLESHDLVRTLETFRASGIRCVAAHPHAPEATLSRAGLRRDCCLVFGSEGDGLTHRTLAACDEAVSIPMAAGVDSLNVANAAAVFLYEALRQRTSG